MSDNIRFLIKESPVTGGPSAAIEINGRDLIDLLRELEEAPAAAEGHPDLAGDYAYRKPASLLRDLQSACGKGSYAALYGAPVVCCGDCGDSGCWSVSVHVTRQGDKVLWHDLAHNHRDWSYPISFTFDAASYDAALNDLNFTP